MEKQIIRSICVILASFITQPLYAQKEIKLYLATKGPQNADGTIDRPFYDFKDISNAIRDLPKTNKVVKVIIRQGTYELSEPLMLNNLDSRDSTSSIEFMPYPGEKVIISGGKILAGTWIKTKEENIWKLKIDSFLNKRDVFRALYLNGQRLPRASSDTLYSKGPIPEFASYYKKWDWSAIRKLAKDSIEVFCGFAYNNNDLDLLKDKSAEIIVYNSWEASWHSLRRIDKDKKTLYFNNPLTYPVGFFNSRIRYRVENSKIYLNKSGEWILDHLKGEVFYYAKDNQNPNELQFTVPVLDTLLVIKGNVDSGGLVSNIKFTDINFRYSKSAWGVNSIPLSYKNANAKRLDWVKFDEGFSSVQAALDCGSAIYLDQAQNCVFDKCNFEHLGNYAIWIGQYSRNNIISRCNISNIGGGGIIIGVNITGAKNKIGLASKSPSYNQIINSDISNCGIVFPSGVGIGIMQANHTLVKSNILHNLPYTGISVGWTYNFDENYTINNQIENNYIHDVMKVLADGAGIYTLGKQTGTIYRGNYIKNVYRSQHSVGGTNNGFFFDQGSSDFRLENNVVESIHNEDFRYNKAKPESIHFQDNYFEKSSPNRSVREKVILQWKN